MTDPIVSRRPLLLGHRGCRRAPYLENSLAAFEYALASGCDGFEFDVRHTRDERNVLWHDPDCNGRQIATTDYSALMDRNGSPLATLEDVLRQLGGRAYLDIELKVSGGEEAVISALRATPPQRGFIVSSFYPEILARLRELDSDLPLGFICDREYALDAWADIPAQVILPRHDLLRPQLVNDVHSSGRRIMAWTVNQPDQMRRVAQVGVDGVISDFPELLYQTFHSA